VLPDGVDLMNAGAACQQEARDFLLFGEGDGVGWKGHQRRSSAGDEAENQIVPAGRLGNFGDTPGSGFAARVRHGMAGFIELDALQTSDVRVLDVDETGGDGAAENALRGAGHGSAGLPRPHHIDIPVSRIVAPLQVAGDGCRGISSGECRVEDLPGLLPEKTVAHFLKIGWSRMNWTATAGSSPWMGTCTS